MALATGPNDEEDIKIVLFILKWLKSFCHYSSYEVLCGDHMYEVCSNSIRIGIVVVVHWLGCVCNQS